jgi:hypothetical protein
LQQQTTISVVTYAMLAGCAAATFLLPDGLGIPDTWAAPSSNEIRITGTVRDFRATHPDFGVDPAAEYGHRAGLVELALGSDNRPVRDVPAGFEVATQWYDKSANPIPPHLYIDPDTGGGPVGDSIAYVEQSPQLSGGPKLDTFDSVAGPYPSCTGGAPTFQTGASIPNISPPGGLPSTGKYEKAGGTHTISSSFKCDEFIVKDGARVRISGHVVIRVDTKVDIINRAEIQIMPDSSLELWAGKDFQITDQAEVNVNTADPTICKIFYWSGNGNTFKLQNQTTVYATVLSPDADLLLQDGSDLMGSYSGKRLIMQNNAGYHHDVLNLCGSPAPAICGDVTNDTLGASGGVSTAAITSVESFEEWFKDQMGTNLSAPHTIVLTDNGSGIYEYSTAAFHPIDDRLFGNEGEDHNFNLTFSFSATFVFDECGG